MALRRAAMFQGHMGALAQRRIVPMQDSPPSLAGRLLAALVLGLVLLLLSAMLQTAAASAGAGGGRHLWAFLVAAVFVALTIAVSASTLRVAWGRLCLANAVVSAFVLVAAFAAARTPDMPFDGGIGYAPWDANWLAGPALGSAVLGLAAVVSAVFLAAAWLLLQRKGTDRHAH